MLAVNKQEENPESLAPAHIVTSLDNFINLVTDTAICGNYLDGKDLNPCLPSSLWAMPLFDSTNAWNQTMPCGSVNHRKKRLRGNG
ncbi:hypothetical protein JVT61DRAFT_3663 [Boletus reticuloceps]|uniref:Uncharacterized protein n=1 Tax=Boletus reticuloceps TaxID=495285 RepID=A0A8I2YMP2_9AGAM|nr:hypothetical protein JVT61DRAFT_3663 [Boletus reticuloceps]